MYRDHQEALDEPQDHSCADKKENSDVPLILKAYEVSLQELEVFVKSALDLIRSGINLPGPLISMTVDIRSVGKYLLEWTFVNPGKRLPQDFTRDTVLSNLRVRLGGKNSSEPKPLCTQDNVVKTEVLETTIGMPPRAAIIKRYQCGPSNFSIPIKEALLQERVRSKHTCRLLDINICRGSSALFQVELVMEKLERDLAADIQSRKNANSPYTGGELWLILDCIADALFFAKMRVRTT